MGEYADMSIEFDFNDYIDSIDDYYGSCFGGDFHPYPSKVNVTTESHLSIVDFSEGDKVHLINDGIFDRVCIIVKKTDKAILFKIDKDSEPDIKIDFMFWLPKSVLFMKKDEKRIYHIKHWATIKNIARKEE